MFVGRELQKLVSFIDFCDHVEPHKSPFCPKCCWLWKGKNRIDSASANKFGVFLKHTPYGRKEIRAHRAIWMAHHEVEIPASVHLYQHCDRTLCCNPSHIFLFQKTPSHKDLQRCFVEVMKMHHQMQEELEKLWVYVSHLKSQETTHPEIGKPAKLI